jgi:hypothetical protein
MTAKGPPTIMDHIMNVSIAPALDLKTLILQAIQTRDYRPVDLIAELVSTSRVSESQLKASLAALVEARQVELTPDRYVKRTP